MSTPLPVQNAPPAEAAVLSAMAAFFKQTSAAGGSDALSQDTALLSSGLLDSLSMLQLTAHLSDTFGVDFDDEDFTTDNFATAGRVATLVAQKISRSG